MKSYKIILVLIFLGLATLVKTDTSLDHENCNGRGTFWDGSKCGSCLAPWTGDFCENLNPCNWNGNWNGTGCDCPPWTTASSNCSFNTNLGISCYYGNAENSTEYGPYCSCGGGAYGTQCESLYDYKDCITGTVNNYYGNGSEPWKIPTCKCPDESYTLNSGNCDCSSGYQYVNFGEPCTKTVVESNNDPTKNNDDPTDFEVAKLAITVIFGIFGVISTIATFIKIRAWHIQKKHEGREITLRSYLSCVPCIDLFKKRKPKAVFFTTNSKITLSRNQSDSDIVSDIETEIDVKDIETEIGSTSEVEDKDPTIVEPETNLGQVSKENGHCSIL